MQKQEAEVEEVAVVVKKKQKLEWKIAVHVQRQEQLFQYVYWK